MNRRQRTVLNEVPAKVRPPATGSGRLTRHPESDIWVHFGDLPDTTRKALWEKHERTLAFPAGLSLELLEAAIHEL